MLFAAEELSLTRSGIYSKRSVLYQIKKKKKRGDLYPPYLASRAWCSVRKTRGASCVEGARHQICFTRSNVALATGAVRGWWVWKAVSILKHCDLWTSIDMQLYSSSPAYQVPNCSIKFCISIIGHRKDARRWDSVVQFKEPAETSSKHPPCRADCLVELLNKKKKLVYLNWNDHHSDCDSIK